MALRGAQGDRPTEGREAPEARAAQPSRNDGIWKTREGLSVGVEIYENPAGSSGGSAEGASEGRQPLTGPLCRTPRRQPKQWKRKSFRARSVLITFVTQLHSSTSAHRVLVVPRTQHPSLENPAPNFCSNNTPNKKEKGPPPRGEPLCPYGPGVSCERKLTHCGAAQAAYFHKLLYLAAMPSVRSTSLSTRPSTSS